MNKKEFFDSFVIVGSLIVLFCILIAAGTFLVIHYWSVAIGEIPLGAFIGLIAYVGSSLKLLNIILSIFKEIRSIK